MNSLSCRAQMAPRVTNRALGPTKGLAIGPSLQFTKSSGYDPAEEEQLKAEQSATTDLPLHSLTVEMREGILAASASTIISPYGQAPASYFKRTAHALATLAPQSKSEQAATMGCLPAFAAKLSFGCKKSAPAQSQSQAAITPRRQLLPPPKTQFLPSGDPLELRQIIKETQKKRSQTIEEARVTARMQSITGSHVQLRKGDRLSGSAKLRAAVTLTLRNQLKRLTHLLGDFIDKLAVA